jgi:signal transduction histidine kinase
MTDAARVAAGRTMSAIAVITAVGGLFWLVALGHGGAAWNDWIVHNGIVAIGTAVIAWLVVPSQPRNGAIWVLAWAGLLTGLETLAYAVVVELSRVYEIGLPVFDLVPASVPTSMALVIQQMNWLWIGVLLLFAVLPLFPDGHPPSPRWRIVVAAQLFLLTVTSIGLFWEARPSGTFTVAQVQDLNGGFRSLTASLVTLGYPLTFVTIVAGVGALLTRYRRSTGEERQQFRWVSWGAAVLGVSIVIALAGDQLADRHDIALFAAAVAIAALLVSLGIAIGKYRLYDIDIVISRSFVFGTLALFITGAYVGVVVGAGSLLGVDETSPVLSIVAIAVVAIAFQPLRRRLQRIANRIAFGRRATPYEVLSEFSRRVAATDESALADIARSLVEGTSATHAAVWLGSSGSRRPAASWPDRAVAEPTLETAIVHGNDELGAVTLSAAPGSRLAPADAQLLDEVAGGLGLVLRNLRLRDKLRDRVDELRASRRRIVAVRDETRRTLERNLHDGAQQQLVAIKVKLGLARQFSAKTGAMHTNAIINEIATRTDDAIEAMRDFARGIYPPLLETEGLAQALSAQIRKLGLPVTVVSNGFGRHASQVESTLYFCAVDLLARTEREGTDAEIRLVESDGACGFELTLTGGSSQWSDTALADLADRIDAAGGTLLLARGEQATTVEAVVPEVTG